jgi:hypothetical protein
MKNRLVSRIGISVITLFLIGIVIAFLNSFYGNPVSAAIATAKIKSYVSETYTDMDYEMNEVTYNFKFSEYYSVVKFPSSEDSCFMVSWRDGKIYDDYEYEVANLYSTYRRLQKEFSKTVEDIINKEFPYETSILFADFFCTVDSYEGKLTLDMPFDIYHLPLPSTIIIYIVTKDVSYENLSSRLKELNTLMSSHQIKIDFYSMVLQEPLPEEEKAAPDGKSLYLYEFPAEKIDLEQKELITEMKSFQNERENEEKEKDSFK